MNIWTTQSGDKINVKDMTTQHILNCIKCIETGRIQFTVNLGYFEDNDCQIIDEDEEGKCKWLEIFKAEISRRNRYEI